VKIKEIELEDFRGFKKASIELKPLTVLLGANSSGKSSFGHALAAMAHAQWLHATSNKASLTPGSIAAHGWPVDLGTLEDLRRYGASGPVGIGLRTSEGWAKWGFGLDPSARNKSDLSISRIEFPTSLGNSSPEISDDKSYPRFTQPIAVSGSIVVGPSVVTKADNSLSYRRVDPVMWQGKPEEGTARIGFDGLVLNAIDPIGSTSREVNSLARKELLETFQHLGYLRATRDVAVRYHPLATSTDRQANGYSGEFTADVIHSRADDLLALRLPPHMPTSADKSSDFAPPVWQEHRGTLVSALEFWLERLRLAREVRALPSERSPSLLKIQVSLIEGQPHDITEVGFGVSQVLPVLVAGLIQAEESLLVVDLPEGGLHPRPQAALADFFCSLALMGKTTLVETHSDMFINQLRYWTAIYPDLRDKIAVYFIDDPDCDGCCIQPRPIGLGFEDELNWPAGFMQEAWEVETLISAARKLRREQKDDSGAA
jgi:predicted ATPase